MVIDMIKLKFCTEIDIGLLEAVSKSIKPEKKENEWSYRSEFELINGLKVYYRRHRSGKKDAFNTLQFVPNRFSCAEVMCRFIQYLGIGDAHVISEHFNLDLDIPPSQVRTHFHFPRLRKTWALRETRGLNGYLDQNEFSIYAGSSKTTSYITYDRGRLHGCPGTRLEVRANKTRSKASPFLGGPWIDYLDRLASHDPFANVRVMIRNGTPSKPSDRRELQCLELLARTHGPTGAKRLLKIDDPNYDRVFNRLRPYIDFQPRRFRLVFWQRLADWRAASPSVDDQELLERMRVVEDSRRGLS